MPVNLDRKVVEANETVQLLGSELELGHSALDWLANDDYRMAIEGSSYWDRLSPNQGHAEVKGCD